MTFFILRILPLTLHSNWKTLLTLMLTSLATNVMIMMRLRSQDREHCPRLLKKKLHPG